MVGVSVRSKRVLDFCTLNTKLGKHVVTEKKLFVTPFMKSGVKK